MFEGHNVTPRGCADDALLYRKYAVQDLHGTDRLGLCAGASCSKISVQDAGPTGQGGFSAARRFVGKTPPKHAAEPDCPC